jgi:hypothetical protein
MFQEARMYATTKTNLESLLDLDIMLIFLHCLVLFFSHHTCDNLICLSQGNFYCDFMIVVKLTQVECYKLYIDPLVKYLDNTFMSFNKVYDQILDQI